MTRALALVVVLAVSSCTSELRVAPIVDLPVDDLDAEGFAAVDEITITIARAGAERDLVTQTFTRGEPLVLDGAPFGEELVLHLTGYIGPTVVAYGRTCAFDVDPSAAPPAPHVYFSRTVKFGSLGFSPATRSDGEAAALDGAALLIGGVVGADVVRDVERFDPRTGALATIGQIRERLGAVSAQLGTSPARLVVVGGQVGTSGAPFIEVVDGTRVVEEIADGRMARLGLTATALSDGRVIVIGGHPPAGVPVGAVSELAVSGPTVEIRDLRAVLAHPRTGHTATRLGDDVGAAVLIAGGLDATGAPAAVAELFKPLREELASPTTFAPTMVVPRTRHHAAMMPDGSVLVIGGVDGAGAPARTLELFTVDAGFTSVGELPTTSGIVDMSVTELPDGRILITGGRTADGGAALDTAYIARLDPLDGSVDVVATDRLAQARAGHHAARLCDGTILISGGTALAQRAERYNPPPAGRR